MFLTKINFINGINLKTPDCVIKDIVSPYGIKYENENNDIKKKHKLIKLLEKIQPYVIKEPLTGDDMSKIASFLNPNCEIKWSSNGLKKAFSNTYFAMELCDVKCNIKKEIDYGYPDEKNPLRLSPAIVYGFLLKANININSKCTENNLYTVHQLSNEHINLTKELIKNAINVLNKNDMMSLASSIKELSLIKQEINKDLVKKIYPKLGNKISKKYSIASSNEHAIALAAKIYNKDISLCFNPLAEYYTLSTTPNEFPITKSIRKIYQLNPHCIDIRSVFNPIFPQEAYSVDVLINYSKKYKLDTKNPIVIYNKLCARYLTNSFYYGLIPFVQSYETPIELEDIFFADFNKTIISYGAEGKYDIYTVDELILLFNSYGSFQYSEENSFDLNAIETLYKLCEFYGVGKKIRISESKKNKLTELKKIIEEIKINMSEIFMVLNNHFNYMNMLKKDDKSILIDLLYSLLNCALFARGWTGEIITYDNILTHINVLPIFFLPRYNNETSIKNTTVAIINFLENTNKFPVIGKYIRELPLLRLYNKELQRSLNSSQGFSIYDRLMIVSKKEDEAWSCIRVSSNWFLVSACTYLGEYFPIKIDEYEHS